MSSTVPGRKKKKKEKKINGNEIRSVKSTKKRKRMSSLTPQRKLKKQEK